MNLDKPLSFRNAGHGRTAVYLGSPGRHKSLRFDGWRRNLCRLRAWRNGRRARLRIWFRKDWRFKSSRAHHFLLRKQAILKMFAQSLHKISPEPLTVA